MSLTAAARRSLPKGDAGRCLDLIPLGFTRQALPNPALVIAHRPVAAALSVFKFQDRPFTGTHRSFMTSARATGTLPVDGHAYVVQIRRLIEAQATVPSPKPFKLMTKDVANNDDLQAALLQCVGSNACAVMISVSGGAWAGKPKPGEDPVYLSRITLEAFDAAAKARPEVSKGGTGGIGPKVRVASEVIERGGNLLIASPDVLGKPVSEMVKDSKSTVVVGNAASQAAVAADGPLVIKIGTDSIVKEGRVNQDTLAALYQTALASFNEENPLIVLVISGAGAVGRKELEGGGSKMLRASRGMALMCRDFEEIGKKAGLDVCPMYVPDSTFRKPEGFKHHQEYFEAVTKINLGRIKVGKQRAKDKGEEFKIEKVGLLVPIYNQADTGLPDDHNTTAHHTAKLMLKAVPGWPPVVSVPVQV